MKKKNKKLGIILLVIAGLALLGSLANGTLASMGEENIFTAIGFLGALVAVIVFGILNLTGGSKE